MRGSVKFTYKSVRLWFRRLKKAFPKPTRRRRSLVAGDETKLKLNGEQLCVWAAVDVKTKEVLACRVSWSRSSLDAEWFFKKLLETCTNKPLILNKAYEKNGIYTWDHKIGRLCA